MSVGFRQRNHKCLWCGEVYAIWLKGRDHETVACSDACRRAHNAFRHNLWFKSRYDNDPEFKERTHRNHIEWHNKKLANDPEYRERYLAYQRAYWAERREEELETA